MRVLDGLFEYIIQTILKKDMYNLSMIKLQNECSECHFIYMYNGHSAVH